MLRAKSENNSIVLANQAVKGLNYICPHCNRSVIFKNGGIKRAHFAHKNKRDYYCHKGETFEHYQLKYLLAQWFEYHAIDVALEPYVPQSYQYPDLIINHTNVIEIQFSQIPIFQIQKRTKSLLALGYSVIWIIKNPNYNEILQTLKLSNYERTFINNDERRLFAWDEETQQLYQYSALQFLGGQLYFAKRNKVSIGALIRKPADEDNNLLFKLKPTAVSRYIKQCRLKRTVLEPSLSVMYNLHITETWVCNHLGLIFPEQLYIKSHPIYWQLQLLFMLHNKDYKARLFLGLIEFNPFYMDNIDKEKIVRKVVRQFQQLYVATEVNSVQNLL